MKTSTSLARYAPLVLRLALAAVLGWFGTSQLLSPNNWINIVPDWATNLSGMSALTVVTFNGWFEIVFALLLAAGIQTRIVATILFLHLLTITSGFGFSATGIRDFGLSFAMLSVALFGTDEFSFDYKQDSITTSAASPVKE